MIKNQISLLTLFFICLAFAPGSMAIEVPRDRLVTDAELISMIDFSIPNLDAVQEAMHDQDTVKALQYLSVYFKNRTNVRYFFHHSDVEKRIQKFASLYPREVGIIQNDAQEFISTFGPHVDWRIPGTDLLGRPHTPNTIRQLARQSNSKDIALSRFINDDPAYRDFLLKHFKDFARAYEQGETQVGANHIFERFYAGLRVRHWLSTHYYLLADPEYDWEAQILTIKLMILHAAQLYDSGKDFNWGNHQLVGLTGAFEITTMFPEFPVMGEWNERVLQVILEHLEKEIEKDGFQFERASHYHKRDIYNYIRVFRLAQINGIELPQLFNERFKKMFDSLVALAMPSKTLPIMHDVTRGIGGIEESIVNEMSLGALLYEDPVYKHFAAEILPADYYWLFDADAIQKYDNIQAQRPGIGSTSLPDSEFYIMRTGWTDDDLYLQIDAGLAQHKPDHTHGQVLGVTGYAYGEQLLPNYPVVYRDRSYQTLKNSLVKSVALADNILQGQKWVANKARTGFGIWAELPEPSNQQWFSGEKFDYFSGKHNGFESSDIDYTRSIFFFKPYYWIFIDEFQGKDRHNYQQIWQGSYTIDPINNSATQYGEKANLLIRQADPTSIEIGNVTNYHTESVQFVKTGKKDYRFATLVYPFSGEIPDNVEIREYERSPDFRSSMGGPFFRKIIITDENREGYLYFADDYKIELERIVSDSKFVKLAYTDQQLEAAMMHQGMNMKTDLFDLHMQSKSTVELYNTEEGHWQIYLIDGEMQDITIEWTDGSDLELTIRPNIVYDLQ